MRDKQSLTRDEIQARIGELDAKKRVLTALSDASTSSAELKEKLRELTAKLTTSNRELADYAAKTERLRQKCLTSRISAKATGQSQQTEACQEYETAIGSAGDEISGNSDLYACVKDLDFQVNGVNTSRAAFQVVIDEIDDEIEELELLLLRAGTKFPSLARHAADSQDQLDSRWLRFHFNSSHTLRTQDRRSSYTSIASSFKASGLFWSAQASFSYSKSESEFRAAMNSADLKVEGELLRVVVQRPWFRPSLFKSKQFHIRVR